MSSVFVVPSFYHIANAFHLVVRCNRVIEASQFLTNFSSDRMHMYNSVTNEWNAPPPTYDCIENNNGKSSNLTEYMTITEEEIRNQHKEDKCNESSPLGVIYNLLQLKRRFGL